MKRKSKENQEKLSPGRRQYLNIKNQYQDCLLLYRMGDFYETFDEDAKILSSVLDIALTARDVGAKNKVPLAGIPYHSLDNSLSKLMDSGLKVAIAEQTSDPKDAKGIVDRAVTRVVTPGTVTAPDMLNANENNFLVSIVIDKEEVDISALDVSTGKFETYCSDLLNLQNEIERLNPKEIIFVKVCLSTPRRFKNYCSLRRIKLLPPNLRKNSLPNLGAKNPRRFTPKGTLQPLF